MLDERFVRSITRSSTFEKEKKKSFARNWNSGSLTGTGIGLCLCDEREIYSIRGGIMRGKSANHETPSCSTRCDSIMQEVNRLTCDVISCKRRHERRERRVSEHTVPKRLRNESHAIR